MADKNEVVVWDLAVRIFHWSLVLFFAFSYLSAEFIEEDQSLHSYSGYIICSLLLFRIIWGFVGSKHARFSDFIYPPAQVKSYLLSLKAGSPQHYLGHNPAGGWMVLALLITLLLTCATGLKTYGADGHGPLAGVDISLISTAQGDSDDDDNHEGHNHKKKENPEMEFWEEIHEFFINLAVLLILLHIAGVIVSSRLHKENLVHAMVTGKKSSEHL